MNTLAPDSIGEVLHRIYAARIPGRVEWLFDDGFVWVLVGQTANRRARVLPRLWLDDAMAGARTLLQSQVARQAEARTRRLERDWLQRGRERTIGRAVWALAEAIAQCYPQSDFVRWWRAQHPA